jgi:hypothetical protein
MMYIGVVRAWILSGELVMLSRYTQQISQELVEGISFEGESHFSG